MQPVITFALAKGRLAEQAFELLEQMGAVKLGLEEGVSLGKLDLCLLSEVKRNEKGTEEVKVVDRLKALEQLALLAESGGSDLESFIKALQGGEAQS